MNNKITLKLSDLNDWTNDFTSITWHLNKLEFGDSVELDMCDQRFLLPGGILILTLLCSSIYNITEEQVKLRNLNSVMKQYLDRMNFFNFNFVQKEKIGIMEMWDRNPNTNTLLELSYLRSPYPELAQVVIKLKQIMNEWVFKQEDRESCDNVVSMIMELCNNSFEHSIIKDKDTNKYGTCYVLAQVYNYGKYKEVDIAIGDLGIGIRKSLEIKYNWIYPSDTMVLKKVLDGLSGRTISDSGGSGIPFVKESTTNKFEGEFCLRTGKAMVKCDTNNKRIFREHIYPFPGTQCTIKLICK